MYPDIEIYIKNTSIEDITAWLTSELGTTKDLGIIKSGLHHFTVEYQDKTLPVMIFPNAVGKAWTSVWFDTADTPWDDDLTCGTVAAQALETEVRCTRSGWTEDQDPDEWTKISATGETEDFLWKK